VIYTSVNRTSSGISVPAPPSQDLTQLLLAWRDGDQAALDLRRLARRYMELESARA
jgi:hypothetical protein